ncbi:MAG: hypothetical protein PHS95_00880 [Candidatus Pacebacteria bacterium]|nr:hypothetical protein [Candidatus Paceibacterota bacterium]
MRTVIFSTGLFVAIGLSFSLPVVAHATGGESISVYDTKSRAEEGIRRCTLTVKVPLSKLSLAEKPSQNIAVTIAAKDGVTPKWVTILIDGKMFRARPFWEWHRFHLSPSDRRIVVEVSDVLKGYKPSRRQKNLEVSIQLELSDGASIEGFDNLKILDYRSLEN